MLEHDQQTVRPETSVVFIFCSTSNQIVIIDVVVFFFAAFVIFRDLNNKNASINYTTELA